MGFAISLIEVLRFLDYKHGFKSVGTKQPRSTSTPSATLVDLLDKAVTVNKQPELITRLNSEALWLAECIGLDNVVCVLDTLRTPGASRVLKILAGHAPLDGFNEVYQQLPVAQNGDGNTGMYIAVRHARALDGPLPTRESGICSALATGKTVKPGQAVGYVESALRGASSYAGSARLAAEIANAPVQVGQTEPVAVGRAQKGVGSRVAQHGDQQGYRLRITEPGNGRPKLCRQFGHNTAFGVPRSDAEYLESLLHNGVAYVPPVELQTNDNYEPPRLLFYVTGVPPAFGCAAE
ncbi:hypothetical protein Rhopal_005107-T1 [Rhodotorula paludigena]|uniref:Uncharacterized protein n=1 Tax=Rhodotorula paludigena TaxID=86838 RepID=A0AAV5GU04_9BASI|nr:hypothetical protein Rhopal_005107-T1 [Rhodotorula paludigena]